MARINLLTIHWGCSYGGTMQTYATVKTLQGLGHKVKVINLVHPKTKFKNKYRTKTSLNNLIREFQFYLFRKFYIGHFTKKMYSIKSRLIPECDYTIVGSDQVWNSDITSTLKMSYFLDFETRSTKLSYASSFGKSTWKEEPAITSEVHKCLSSFKAISVRETTGVDICQNIFGVKATLLLDPTLIHANFDRLVKKKPIHEVFPFLLKKNAETNSICQLVSKELGLPLYSSNRYRQIFRRSPREWLNRIKNSDFIITDSFHGLAFSLLFHKHFIVLCANEQKFVRLKSLLNLLHLENRFIKSFNDLTKRESIINEKINYMAVDEILDIERQKAISFLKTYLQ